MYVCICITFLLISTPICTGQPDYEHSYTADKMPLSDKALFLADSLVQHPVFFRKLLDIANSGQSLLQLGGNDPKFSFLLDIWMDELPAVLKSPDTINVLSIFADELRRVNLTDVKKNAEERQVPQNSTEFKQEMGDAILERINKGRLLQRILTSHSLNDYLPLNNNTIGLSCYNDFINFLDTGRGIQFQPRQDLNFSTVPWAMKMLDSIGKPPSGILEGADDWEGSSQECRGIRAHLDPGVIVGNKTLKTAVDFSGKYCHIHFNLDSQTGLLKTLKWGICVPDSCSERDIKTIAELAKGTQVKIVKSVLSMFKFNISAVTCYDKNQHIPVMKPRSLGFYRTCVGNKSGLDLTFFTKCFASTFDYDNNGDINITEWRSEYRQFAPSYARNLLQTFFTLDTNKNLFIDSVDLRYIFHMYDDNGDREVSFQEFDDGWKTFFM